MEDRNTTAITTVKQDVQMQEWIAQVQEQKASGLTVQGWCAENGINPKTYYYHLRKVREMCLDSVPAIVPLAVPERRGDIRIERNGTLITLPSDISSELLLTLVRELC